MSRPRLSFHDWPAAVYAIGDVHGCLSQLQALEAQILGDRDRIPGEKWIINLGDYIDRGPNSRGVVEHLLQPLPAGWKRFSLVGNHEEMLLDFLADPENHGYWLEEGGLPTLKSYGIDAPVSEESIDDIRRAIPQRHVDFVANLPIGLSLPGWYFVHAGLRPGVAIADQTDDDMTTIRNAFLRGAPFEGLRVVHGHTPAPEPVVTLSRVGIDTHCFWSGKLTALRVLPTGAMKFFTAAG